MSLPFFGERGAENVGLAVFKDDKLVGELNGIETVCYSLISDVVQGFFITIPDPDNDEGYIDLYLHHNHATSKQVEIINGTPYINISCELEGRIYSIKGDTDYSDDNFLSSVSYEASKYMELELSNYLYKTAKKYMSDISGFGKNALNSFTTIKDFEDYKWEDNYQNSFFNVKCNVSIKSGNLITEI